MFWQAVRDGAPLLTLLAILATLRGQRLTNAHAARERLNEARNEAHMVILDPRHPEFSGFNRTHVDGSVVVLSVEVTGPAPIVKVESVLVEPQPTPGVEKLRGEMLKTRQVIKAQSSRSMGTIQDSTTQEGVLWRLTWEDRHGYVWRNRYDFEVAETLGVELVQSPTGKTPIVHPNLGQKIRNTLLPYDNWDPRRKPGA